MTHRTIVLATLGALMITPAPALAKQTNKTITLKARSQLEQAKLVDALPVGPSAGDQLIFTERLFNNSGKRIGSDAATCVRLFDQKFLCTATYKLPGGLLMVQLLQPGLTVPSYHQAITGGTGRYAGARGTVKVAQKKGGDRFTFKIRL